MSWIALAALGLLAVALAALSVLRPPRDWRSLMEQTTELRETGARDVPAGEPDERQRAASESPWARRARPDESIEAPSPPVGEPPAGPPAPSPTERANAGDAATPILALHHVDLSIEVLRRHLQKEGRPMPAVWLMLLDLARTHGRELTFRELALEFHQRFNVRAPAWDGYPPDRDEPGLEAYPRLVKEITLTWGTHECARLLDRLLYDNRGGDRRGFTLNAYNDLIALRRAADAVLDTIQQDLAEEAKVRSAFASASAEIEANAETEPIDRSPLVRDLESQLDSDLRAGISPQSALEQEHPALARMLAREWGNAALSVRLCEMLARGGDGTHALSREATEDVELLRNMAERLASVNGLTLVTSETE